MKTLGKWMKPPAFVLLSWLTSQFAKSWVSSLVKVRVETTRDPTWLFGRSSSWFKSREPRNEIVLEYETQPRMPKSIKNSKWPFWKLFFLSSYHHMIGWMWVIERAWVWNTPCCSWIGNSDNGSLVDVPAITTIHLDALIEQVVNTRSLRSAQFRIPLIVDSWIIVTKKEDRKLKSNLLIQVTLHTYMNIKIFIYIIMM
jgi:hypothetical protein